MNAPYPDGDAVGEAWLNERNHRLEMRDQAIVPQDCPVPTPGTAIALLARSGLLSARPVGGLGLRPAPVGRLVHSRNILSYVSSV